MYLKIKKLSIKSSRRFGGRDHIWLVSHDEGPCWVPTELWPSIILSHWGRKACYRV